MTLPFLCEKTPATGSRGVVVTNAPLGTAAGAEMLAIGGNAIDASVAALLTLTAVEPMMVGIAGGGIAHLRLSDGRHVVIDALSCAGQGARPDMFTPLSDHPDAYMETEGRRNRSGPSSVAVPGNLRGWYRMQQSHGRLPWADVVEPAIRAAAGGFSVSPYLHGAIREHQDDLRADPDMARLFLPGGMPLPPGARLTMSDYAQSLHLVRDQGDAALHGGDLGRALADSLAAGGGHVTLADLMAARAIERDAIMGAYRGHVIAGPPPPASSGVHVAQMLNMLEPYDLRGMGFASADAMDLMARAMALAFQDRRAASGDPDFVDVPVDRFLSKNHARQRMGSESRDTTHVTIADADGNIVSATHTINGLWGACFMVPGTGIIPNNYMLNYDPRPGLALSVAPGKRVPTSMAPMMVLRDRQPVYALGLPGGVRIFPSAMQAIVNLIDHGMTLQQAVEAPRLWTEGHHLELEPAYAAQADAMRARGHDVRLVKIIGGGMNAISFGPDGAMTGAACWRADGTVMAQGGGLARPGIRFVI
ncbi:gamma-glutamyltransferase family protein [Paracoccus sediminis]|uniref:Gamma-glutamyltransferase family protein n=1 Tax=Paracoccus sediminis TaxID=1214787 RepID=A0A238X3N5_9RHOB|nr:gamma-glutamyltransferase family protein [Paracoccus sediminis]TBN49265.1 gamma-glutamyltransferase family protein [Paracoccus sediminis]SNR53262.1 gamma-glutamyltranspeptidase / glutathione hydrolase [Paracoccus sediminis]